MSRIMFAAPMSGSGKTIVTCAVLKALKDRHRDLVSYKCGPDYIDPMFHSKVLGIPSRNVDGYFLEKQGMKSLLSRTSKKHSICVFEGVMGLYDGLGGVSLQASSYEVACQLEIPIVLVINARGMGRTILSLIRGIKADDRQGLIKGVILNQVSEMWYPTLAKLIEEEAGLKVLGFLPKDEGLVIPSRHLGLYTPQDMEETRNIIAHGGELAEKFIDLDGLEEIAAKASDIIDYESELRESVPGVVKIGLARDEAFCFLYEENQRVLESMGAEIVPFSPIHDEALPEGLDGLVLCGGYPENYLKELAANKTMLASVKEAIDHGMPSIAECGGFLYLHRRVADEAGNFYPMVGVIGADAEKKDRLVRFGYVELQDPAVDTFIGRGESIRGHEFHYYDSTDNGEDLIAVKPVSGRKWSCVHAGSDHWWGFPHTYYDQAPQFAKRFIDACVRYYQNSDV